MKNIAIIGAGISGLRAALELCGTHKISLYEKSPSVGGRLASRRFGQISINHGASTFTGLEYLAGDAFADRFKDQLSLNGPATDLPKGMRDILLAHSNLSVHFKTKVSRINRDLSLELETGEVLSFDHIIITAPVPQVREMLGEILLPEISYTKQISFIGIVNDSPVKCMLTEQDSEKFFEASEQSIRLHADKIFGSTVGLDVKKWRYSRVLNGHKDYFYEPTKNIHVCGDAFDPHQNFHLGSAWRSGVMTARRVL
jgi:predicted NAD/FAD-dependent oxidoreductase